MKILHVLDVSWPIQRGYTIRGYYITLHQKLQGLEPYVLTSERQYEKNFEITDNGIRYYRSIPRNGLTSRIFFINELCQIYRIKRRICNIVKSEGIDIIHAHSPSLWGFAAWLAGTKMKIPVVYEVRAFWEDAAVDSGKFLENSYKYKIYRYLETFAVKKADRVVAICKGIQQDLAKRKISENKITIVPNGIDTRRFRPQKKDQGLIAKYRLETKIVLGFIGSMFNFEGLELLVLAFEQLKDKYENIRLLLIGEGQSYEKIKNMVDQRKLEGDIYVLGKVSHELLKPYYSIIDILIYPRISKRITELVTPLKPLESMAMGKTVIMSDVGGLKELVPDENAVIFFKSGSAYDLASKISFLVDNPKQIRSIGKIARQFVAENRDWRNIVDIYRDFVYTSAFKF